MASPATNILMASSPTEPPLPPGTTATKGIAAVTTTNTAFSGLQTQVFTTPVDLYVTSVMYHPRFAATYDLKIDGVTINSVAGTTVPVEMLAAPITITRGIHTIVFTKTGGSTGWRFTAGNAYVSLPWFHTGYWQEAGGGELANFTITATPTFDLIEAGPTGASTFSGTPRAALTYTIIWNQDVTAYGLFSACSIGAYEILINGVVQGTSATQTGGDVILSLPTPFDFDGGVTYTISLRRVDLVTSGFLYKATSTDSNAYFSQTAWVEQGGATTPYITWLFTL